MLCFARSRLEVVVNVQETAADEIVPVISERFCGGGGGGRICVNLLGRRCRLPLSFIEVI